MKSLKNGALQDHKAGDFAKLPLPGTPYCLQFWGFIDLSFGLQFYTIKDTLTCSWGKKATSTGKSSTFGKNKKREREREMKTMKWTEKNSKTKTGRAKIKRHHWKDNWEK